MLGKQSTSFASKCARHERHERDTGKAREAQARRKYDKSAT